MSNPFKSTIFVVGLLTLIGAVIRFYNLGVQSLWHDEAVIWQIANHSSISEIIVENARLNSAPPLYVLLLSFLMKFGDSEFVLRLWSAIFGIASIPVTYLLSRQFLGRVPSFFVTSIVVVTYTMTKYSQELREYSLTYFLACLLLIIFVQFVKDPDWRKSWLLSTVMVFCVFTQYGLTLLIAVLSCVLVLQWFVNKRERLSQDILRWILPNIFVIISISIVYFVSLKTHGFYRAGTSYLESYYWDGTFEGLFRLLVINSRGLISFAYLPSSSIVSWMLILTLLLGIWESYFKDKNLLFILLLFLPVMGIMAASILQIYPYGGIRQVIFLTPMIYVLLGFGFKWITETVPQRLQINYIRPLLQVTLAGIFLFSAVIPSLQEINDTGDEYIPPLMDTLTDDFQEGDRIYIYESSIPAMSYYDRTYQASWVIGLGGRDDKNLQQHFRQIDELLQAPGRIWLMFTNCYEKVCELIPTYIEQQRLIELKGQTKGAMLYLVP